MTRHKVNVTIDQWKLMGILIVAITNLKDNVWIIPFKKFNLYPKFCVDY